MQIRIAPSLGDLEGHPNDIWGTEEYLDEDAPVVFFGLYGFRDFFSLWNHQGQKHILWAGSDIRHFVNGYWLDEWGDTKIAPYQLAMWINKFCTSWVENEVEQKALHKVGVIANIVPSFLGKIENFPVSFVKRDKVRLYTSVSGNDFELYGWDKIPQLAKDNPEVEFHLYGNTEEPPYKGELATNIFLHGRVPKEEMNVEITGMTGALRLTEFDGFSEILAKSILMGQYPVSLIPYPHMLKPHEIKTLKNISKPNIVGRDYYISKLNKYPWNLKK